jgi:hypothetical protein
MNKPEGFPLSDLYKYFTEYIKAMENRLAELESEHKVAEYNDFLEKYGDIVGKMREITIMADPDLQMSEEWLQHKLTTQETEDQKTRLTHIRAFNEELSQGMAAGSPGVPFPLYDRWKAFIDEMIQGDELWKYRSPEWAWRAWMGSEGIAIVRNGKIVYFYETACN